MKTKSLTLIVLMMTALISSLHAQLEGENWSCTPFEVKTVDAQNALVVKADIPMAEISTKLGEIYNEVFTYIAENNIQPAGPAFAIYYAFEPEGNIVFEAGVPIVGKVDGKDDLVCKEFAKMKALSTLYKGSYEYIEPAYTAMMKHIEEKSMESTGTSWEIYLTDPAVVKDQAMNQTLIYFELE